MWLDADSGVSRLRCVDESLSEEFYNQADGVILVARARLLQ